MSSEQHIPPGGRHGKLPWERRDLVSFLVPVPSNVESLPGQAGIQLGLTHLSCLFSSRMDLSLIIPGSVGSAEEPIVNSGEISVKHNRAKKDLGRVVIFSESMLSC